MSKRASTLVIVLVGLIILSGLFVLTWSAPQRWHSGWAGLFILIGIMYFGMLIMIGLDWAKSHLTQSAKIALLSGVTSLTVTFVRRAVQYNRYSWDSVWQFLTWWLIHYVGLIIFILVAGGCIVWAEKYLFNFKNNELITPDTERLAISILIVVLVATAAIFGLNLFADSGQVYDDLDDYGY